MIENLRAFAGGFVAEALHLRRSPLFLVLTVVQAVTFLFLVSLFGLTGSRAPTAVVFDDRGPYPDLFYSTLAGTRNSFALKKMDRAAAVRALGRGEIVAILTIPKDFTDRVTHGRNVLVKVEVDNVDTDMTDDVERALPSAIVAFGRRLDLPGIRIHVAETDLIPHDTGFIPYLVVSGLVLDAFLIAGMLSAMTVAREFEARTIPILAVAPAHPIVPIAGRVLATAVASCVAMTVPIAVVVLAYHVIPVNPLLAFVAVLASVGSFSCLGVVLGAIARRTMPVMSMIFGLAFPLYVCSGSLEPERFDGVRLWTIAHFSPVYYAVGVLENAFHGFDVTPESVSSDLGALLLWCLATLILARLVLGKRLERS